VGSRPVPHKLRRARLKYFWNAALAAIGFITPVIAGDLNPPPGPIAPTNRVQLNGQAIALPYTINEPGSYVLTSDLVGTGAGNGIIINADDVTLDLNGFSIRGATGSGSGVLAIGTRNNIAISNGTITDWDNNGADLNVGTTCQVSNVRFTRNAVHGLRMGSSGVVTDCLASNNGDAGFRAEGNRNRLERNHSSNNARGFFVAGIENLIVKNSAADNGINYVIGTSNGYGPIITTSADLSTVTGGDHPWANFSLTCALFNWCRDADGDLYGDQTDVVTACTAPSGYVADCEDCNDANGNVNPEEPDLCNGIDDDCDSASADGSEDPALGQVCDGADGDLCVEGNIECQGGSLECNDTTGDTPDLCNNIDDDCDSSSVDGSEDPSIGQPCDGADADLCLEGTLVCNSGSLNCSDVTGDSSEVCNGSDDDCDGPIDESACPNGTVCADGSTCQSGFCVDGVCCENACTSLCVACSAAKKGSGADGACAGIGSGLDPDDECAGTQTCDGAGGCQ